MRREILAKPLVLSGLWLATTLGPPAVAQEPAGEVPPAAAAPEACAAIESDSLRLACYDLFFRQAELSGDEAPPAATPGTDASDSPPAAVLSADFVGPPAPRSTALPEASPWPGSTPVRSLLDSRWELDSASKLGVFNLRAYKPIYLLPAFWSSAPNQLPQSPAPDHQVTEPEGLEDIEAKFQVSFKTKLWQGIYQDRGDLWFGYTQSSRWQVYSQEISRPFRETNYEPEALLVFATRYRLLGWDGRLLALGLNHQSNGRENPRSRSWNRVIGAVGFERPGWTLTLRPWWRIHEERDEDDNPDLEDYAGRGDLQLIRRVRHHELALTAHHSLRGGDRSHGGVRLEWAFPIHRNLRGRVELFHGSGESLIDYNHEATYLGFGVSLLEWY